MKKILSIALAAMMSVALVACGSNNDSTTPSTTASDSASAALATPTNVPVQPSNQGSDASADVETPTEPTVNMSTEVDTELVAKFTPEGANVVTSEAGSIMLTSNMSIEELTTFYKQAVQDIGATEITASEIDGWQYTGKHGDDEKDLIVIITVINDENTVAIIY